jgi:putative transposase
MKQWYSAFELAGLSGLPSLPNNIARKAKTEQWKSQPRSGRGGGKEYAYSSLPEQTQKALSEKTTQPAIPTLSGQSSQILHQIPASGKTTIEQRTDAWLVVLRAYEAWGDSIAC